MTEVVATNETILVVGGGISGMTAALEAAETGKQVVLVEKRPYVGGRVSQLYKYFPKLCFPTCGLEINQRRAKMNPNLTIVTMAEVTNIAGEAGNYTATVKISPRFLRSGASRAQISSSRWVSVVALAVPPTCKLERVSSAAGTLFMAPANSPLTRMMRLSPVRTSGR